MSNKMFRKFAVASLLIASLFGALPASSQQEKKASAEYDAGVCSVENFVAVHVVIDDKELKATLISLGPGRVEESKDDVWKFEKADADGSHYTQEEKGVKYELVLKTDDKGVEGILYEEGRKAAYFFGPKADGKSLAEDGMMLYQMCLQMREASPHSES